MDALKILNGLKDGLSAVGTLSSVAGTLGLGGEVGKIAGSLATIGGNAIQRIEDGQIVVSSRDRTLIEHYTKQLASVNDELAKQIAAS